MVADALSLALYIVLLLRFRFRFQAEITKTFLLRFLWAFAAAKRKKFSPISASLSARPAVYLCLLACLTRSSRSLLQRHEASMAEGGKTAKKKNLRGS